MTRRSSRPIRPLLVANRVRTTPGCSACATTRDASRRRARARVNQMLYSFELAYCVHPPKRRSSWRSSSAGCAFSCARLDTLRTRDGAPGRAAATSGASSRSVNVT